MPLVFTAQINIFYFLDIVALSVGSLGVRREIEGILEIQSVKILRLCRGNYE